MTKVKEVKKEKKITTKKWSSPKAKTVFVGKYSKNAEGKRVLSLSPEKGKAKEVLFASHEAAKKSGWKAL